MLWQEEAAVGVKIRMKISVRVWKGEEGLEAEEGGRGCGVWV